MKEKVVLIGSGQHARVVLYNLKAQAKYDVACLLDSDQSKVGKTFEGHLIAGTYEDLSKIQSDYQTNKFFVAFGDMKHRRNVFEFFVGAGWEAVTIIHPNAIVSENASIGKGVLIECGCLITPNPIIGNNVVINTGSQVNHDNVVKDHVYIASGVILSGGVTVHENTLIDDGVIVTLGTSVPPNSIIGAGAVVTKTQTCSGIYYGNPSRYIRSNNKW